LLSAHISLKMEEYPSITYDPLIFSELEMNERIDSLSSYMKKRRTIRDFSNREVPISLLKKIIEVAGTAPSGANKQPWSFCLVTNAALKKAIRLSAEEEERKNYHGRMSEEWLRDLAPLGTDEHKEFLEIAPALIVVFRRSFEFQGEKKLQNYYVSESVGLACGFLIQAIHHCGLVCLTHTPSPMNFLEKILERPANEKAYLLIPVGYPSENVRVPDIRRKKLENICFEYH
jgi:iodotyrosine deiodinase